LWRVRPAAAGWPARSERSGRCCVKCEAPALWREGCLGLRPDLESRLDGSVGGQAAVAAVVSVLVPKRSVGDPPPRDLSWCSSVASACLVDSKGRETLSRVRSLSKLHRAGEVTWNFGESRRPGQTNLSIWRRSDGGEAKGSCVEDPCVRHNVILRRVSAKARALVGDHFARPGAGESASSAARSGEETVSGRQGSVYTSDTVEAPIRSGECEGACGSDSSSRGLSGRF
jgi:hypothetical protein